jgi:hypothetical protein
VRGVTVEWVPFNPIECPEPSRCLLLGVGLGCLVALYRVRGR